MSAAASLPDAAGAAFDNLQVWWLTNQLKTRLGAFCLASRPLFGNSEPNSHPASNWLILLSSLTANLPGGGVTEGELSDAASYVYRLCWMTEFLRTSGLITGAQATGLLGNYNGQLAAP